MNQYSKFNNQIFEPLMGSKQLHHRDREDLGVRAMMYYSTLQKFPEKKSHYHIPF